MKTYVLDDNEKDPHVLWAEIWRLRWEMRGPEGFDTWKDVCIHERMNRPKIKVTDEMVERALHVYIFGDDYTQHEFDGMRAALEAALNGEQL